VRYGDVVAVRSVTFLIPPGGMLAVTGPSGAGKSSLLWAFAGATAHSGTVEVGGVPVVDRAGAAGRGIALAPQGNGLPSFLTAEENVLMPLLAAGVPAADARTRTRDALGLLDLEHSATHLVDELSGGQQQRVALARTLATAPTVVLADEPTSDLDATNRQRVIDALRAQAGAGAVLGDPRPRGRGRTRRRAPAGQRPRDLAADAGLRRLGLTLPAARLRTPPGRRRRS
jgi:putative ABC transport system ATP-binding protein